MRSGILAVATALPEHVLERNETIRELKRFWPRLDRLAEAEAAVATRYTCEPIDRVLRPRGLTELREAYLKHARQLARDAACGALIRAGVNGRDVDVVISVSCTGYLVPSLDVHLAAELGLRPDVIRIPITELGCSAGASAIALGHRHLHGFPDHKVLVVAVEVPSLNFHPRDSSIDNLTACLVFGDGAGAAVMSADGARRGLSVLATASHLVPNTADLLGFDLRDDGFYVVLDRRLPRLVTGELGPAVQRFMSASGLRSLDFVAAHAAGPRIFDAIETALQIQPRALALSREVFAEVGNTSSAAIFFTLEKLIARGGEKPAQGLGLGLGPGVSIELMRLEWQPLENPGHEAGALRESLAVGR